MNHCNWLIEQVLLGVDVGVLGYIKELLVVLAIPTVIVISNVILGYFLRRIAKEINNDRLSDCYEYNISYISRSIAILLDLAVITTFDVVLINQMLCYSGVGARYAEFMWYILIILLSFSVAYFSTFRVRSISLIAIMNIVVFVAIKLVAI